MRSFQVLFSYVMHNVRVEDFCVVQAYSRAHALLQAKQYFAECKEFADVQITRHKAIEV